MMSILSIRPAQVEDIPAIRHIANLAWRKTYGHIFDSDFIAAYLEEAYAADGLQQCIAFPHHCFWVAHATTPTAHTAVGYAHAALPIDAVEGRLFRIYLLPDYWRQGIGSHLLQAVETWLSERQINAYRCFVHQDNAVGIEFYRRKGFARQPEADHDDEWCMRKNIDATPANQTQMQSSTSQWGQGGETEP